MTSMKYINQEISKLLASQEFPLHVDHALTIIGAYLLIVDIDDADSETKAFGSYKTGMRRCINRNGLNDSSFSDICDILFSGIQKVDSETKGKTLLSFNLNLISNIEDSMYISMSDKLFESYRKAAQNGINGKDLSFYSWKPALTVEIKSDITVQSDIQSLIIDRHDQKTEMNNEDSNQCNDSYIKDLGDFIMSRFPVKEYPKGLKTRRYMWEYKLNQSDYSKLKDLLTNIIEHKERYERILSHNIGAYGENNCTIALVVILYLSEWYKRECNILSGDHGLDTIGLDSSKTDQIWNNSHLHDDLLHQQEDRQQLRQMAMCVLGGFPLNYVNGSPRFKNIINNIASFCNNEEYLSSNMDELAGQFDDNNIVFKASLKDGSCRSFLGALIDYIKTDDKTKLPFNQGDLEKEPFSTFLTQLREGYNNDLQNNYFKHLLEVWTEDEDETVACRYSIQIGLKKSCNRITRRELDLLKVSIPDGVTYFFLKLLIVNHDGTSYSSKQSRRFNLIGGGSQDYFGVSGSSLSADIDLFSAKEINLVLDYEGCNEPIFIRNANYKINPYIELYKSAEPFLWTTMTDHSSQKVLLLNRIVYKVDNGINFLCKKNDESADEWMWIYQNEPVTVYNRFTGKNDTFELGASDAITVTFRTSTLGKAIQLQDDKYVICKISEDEECRVPILYYTHDSSKSPQTLSIKCDGIGGANMESGYTFEFKDYDEFNYTKWDNNNYPKQGLISLRIKCNDAAQRKITWRERVYFIPSTSPIKRDLPSHQIRFDVSDVMAYDGTEVTKGIYTDNPETNKDSDTLSFMIGGTHPIKVDVYRAFKLYEIFNNGVCTKSYFDMMSIDMPISNILRHRISVRVIDENGPRILKFGEIPYKDLLERPTRVARFPFPAEEGIYQKLFIGDYDDRDNSTTKPRGITLDTGRMLITLRVSDKYVEQYRFFYWSGDRDDLPIELSKEQIGERHYEMKLPEGVTRDSIVFQSLKNCTPNLYFKPIYPGMMENDNAQWKLYRNRIEMNNPRWRIIKCYDIAVEHSIYFFIFLPLLHETRSHNHLDILLEVLNRKNNVLKKSDIANLQRYAFEVGTDWFFFLKDLKRKVIKGTPEFKKSIEELLLSSPLVGEERYFAERFLKYYWENIYDVSNGNPERCFLNYVKNGYQPPRNQEVRRSRIDFLNQLKRETSLFSKICQILDI